MGATGRLGATPPTVAVQQYLHTGVGPKPSVLARAELLDGILRVYPGYTLQTLLDEDAHELLRLRRIISLTTPE